jgi:hypothetical protein
VTKLCVRNDFFICNDENNYLEYLEEIRCKIVPKPERNTKTIIGGGENYGERPLFVGQGTGFRRYSCGHCKLILVDNVGENIGLVNIVLKCPGCQSYNELTS